MGNSSITAPKAKKPHTKYHSGYCSNKNRSNGENMTAPGPLEVRGQEKKEGKIKEWMQVGEAILPFSKAF
ncbi:MAG: hypothetical protein GWO20_13750 [Candidatus Korarchaeota archaeon]|nr:hypothetical protein [Candidatus Korarchaeota archaeon]NIU84475.1 hypothetical protein [Candidatus Thorarchaeota archaeon]NIW14551.1 hypothetical protein [Candidatus Thorarchaeota archaeon]